MFMQINKKNIELSKKLPRGSKRVIASKTGLSYATVVRYFNGKEVSFGTESLILEEAKIIIEINSRIQQSKKDLLDYGI